MRKFFARNLRALTRLAVVMGVCASSVMATGCYDRQELEQQAFVTSLGIDKAPDGFIDCTFRFAVPQNPSGGGGGSADTPLAGKSPVTYRAHSVTEALLLANSSVERQVSLTHLNNVLFGKDLAQAGLSTVLQAMVRFREFRPTIYVGVADGKAQEVLSAETPVLDKSASRMAESVALVSERTGLVPVTYLRDLRRFIENPQAGGTLPIYSINKAVKADPKGQQGINGTDVFSPGNEPRSGGDPVEWMGAAVFQGDRQVGQLDGRQTMYLQFLKGDLRSTKIDFPDPTDPQKTIGLSLKSERTPHYSVSLASPMKIIVDIPLEAEVLNAETGVDYSKPQNRTKVENYINARVQKDCTSLLETLFHEYKADAIPVTNRMRGRFPTIDAFNQYPWKSKLATAQVQVHVGLHIRRFGVQLIPL